MKYDFNLQRIIDKSNPSLVELGIHCIEPRRDYEQLGWQLRKYEEAGDIDSFRETLVPIAEEDFFAYCFFVLELPVDDPFLMARCYDLQSAHDRFLDLWAREHWKSTIGTFALTLWKTTLNPEERTGIFSYSRNLALGHLRRIKIEMEKNQKLPMCWPDIFYKKPKSQSSKWSEYDGLYVKRQGNYPAATIEAWGLVDNMPTGKHFSRLVFDDIVDPNTVTSSTNIRKAVEAFQMSDNIGTRDCEKSIFGTRYKFNDPYSEIMKKGTWTVRIFAAEVDENGDQRRGGTPIYLTREELDRKYEEQGPYIYSCQMLQFPVDKENMVLHPAWFSYYDMLPEGKLNYYIVVDSGKKKGVGNRSLDLRIDPTVMWAFCVDGARTCYILDGVRDKIDLEQKWERLRDLAQKWGITTVGYEQYGAMTDAQYMEIRSQEDGVYLDIIELNWRAPKPDRILSLVPDFKFRKIKFPKSGILHERVDGSFVNLVDEFIEEEYKGWPFSKKDDMLDCLSRKNDPKLGVVYPVIDHYRRPKEKYKYDPLDIHKDDIDVDEISWDVM